jgi:hypothetical protein
MSRKTVSAVIGSILVVVFALGALQGCGSDGTNGTGTGGTPGTGGTSGTGGTGTGGATATGGTSGTGTGGTSGAAGGSGTAGCSVCDKAQACCVAAESKGIPASLCTLSAASCNAMSGTAQSGQITTCQMVLAEGVTFGVSACQ